MRVLWWASLVGLVLLIDVVTLFFPPFSPEVRWATVTILTLGFLLFAGLRWMAWRQNREQERAAFAALARRPRPVPQP